jgi:hypothetical protein
MFVCCESCVCCQVEVSATSWSPVLRSPTDCGSSLSMIYKPREWGGPGPLGGCRAKNKQLNSQWLITYHAIKASGRVDVWLHAFSHSSRNGGEWSGSPNGRLIPEEKILVNDCIGSLNGSQNQSGSLREEKIYWLWYPRRPARKPRESYPDFSELNCQRTVITDERIQIRCLTS